MRQAPQQPPEPNRTFFYFNLRWGTYTGLAALTASSIVFPNIVYPTSIVVAAYGCYLAIEVFKAYNVIAKTTRKYNKRSLYAALAQNATDIFFYVVCVIVGLLIGLGV